MLRDLVRGHALGVHGILVRGLLLGVHGILVMGLLLGIYGILVRGLLIGVHVFGSNGHSRAVFVTRFGLRVLHISGVRVGLRNLLTVLGHVIIIVVCIFILRRRRLLAHERSAVNKPLQPDIEKRKQRRPSETTTP